MNISKLHIPGAKNLGYVIAEPSGPTPWLVENWIIEGEMAVVHGAANVGKSFAVLDMGLHIALGEKEWVRNSIPRKRPVIYIPSEGMRGVERRLRTWLTVNRPETLEWTTEDYESADLAWMEMDEEGNPVVVTGEADPTAALPFYVYTGEPGANWPILLDKTEEGTRTLDYLREFVAAVMAMYYVAPVIIVDVVGNFAPGLDENTHSTSCTRGTSRTRPSSSCTTRGTALGACAGTLP